MTSVFKEQKQIFILILLFVGLLYITDLKCNIIEKIRMHRCTISENLQNSSNFSQGPKLVLGWTSYFGYPLGDYMKEKQSENCPWSCTFTNNRSLVTEADAVVFHMADFHWNDVPMYRLPYQRYILFNLESPLNKPGPPGGNLNHITNYFNWTATYRTDSDIFWPYGIIVNESFHQPAANNRQPHYYGYDPVNRSLTTVSHHDLRKIILSKTQLAAWFASNCRTSSRRENIVKRMLNFSDEIDIFGGCIPRKQKKQVCAREDAKCYQKLESKYFFYLSFENSICQDYITEKVWNRILYFVVPIVFSRKIIKAHMPSKSFIAVDDFDTISELIQYLLYLRSNITAYMEYFTWKQHAYSSEASPNHNDLQNIRSCKLCEMLHMDLPKKSYSDQKEWWLKTPPLGVEHFEVGSRSGPGRVRVKPG